MEGALALRRWRRAERLTRIEASLQLGVSERMLAYSESEARPTPRAIVLAVRALSAGLDNERDQNWGDRERWVTLVRNLMD